GIQFVVDDSGGFSSVAADFLENIADEYTNTPVMLYSARGPGTYMNPLSQKGSISRALHDAVSFSRLSSLCKLIVPIGLPSLST
ncbi:plasma membrane, autoregulation-binding site, misato segment II, myosin-like, tubulin/FtsZ protein, partial [Thalictrum thalictroides]